MNDNLESEIRKALDAKAYAVDVPSELATRTMDSATHVPLRTPLIGRWRAWRDSRRMRAPVTGYPRWLLVPAAAVSVIALLFVGSMVTRGPGDSRSFSEGYSYDSEQTGEESSSALMPSDEEMDSPALRIKPGAGGSADSVDRLPDAETGETSSGDAVAGQVVGTADADSALDPQLVRGAEIAVAVADFEEGWDKANDIAGEHGGDVINSRTRLVADESAEGTIRMRVPSSELDAVLEDLRGLGTLASLETTGDDIAPDIDQVKRKLKERKERLQELREQKPNTVGSQRADIDRRIVQAESDIESLEKTQDSYEEKVQLSIVNATIKEDAAAAGRGDSMLEGALRTSGRVALTILAGVLVVGAALAPLALIALLIWLAVRAVRGRRAA